MLLTVFCLRRDRSEVTFSLEVGADLELHNFRALCALESGVPPAQSQIVYAEVPLTDDHRSLASYGLKDGDVVILQQVENVEMQPPAPFPGLPRIDFSSIAVPGTSAQAAPLPPPPPPPQRPAPPTRTSPPEVPPAPQGLDNPALLREMLLSNPHELSLLKERNPPLAEALLSGDLEKFSRVLVEQQQDRARREQERIRLFAADPFDLEAQAKIEEDIRQQNIEENMTIAMEEAPESFGQVVMLYINCKVNGHPVKAFVDSGAQMTIMSQACAERCNIMRLVDRRWAGIAKGVGTQKIIGRVHLAQVQIEGDFLPCSFSILEEQPMDMLLGLDMLKRHQCSIDLKKNVLVIGTTGSQTAFLPEGELPECARLAYGAAREDVRPEEEIADHELAEAIQKSVEEAVKTDQETTSPEISQLPSSDDFRNPVRSPEEGVKTGRALDRSVSAPALGFPQHSPAEVASPPRAAKPASSLPQGPAALGREELPQALLNLSGHDPFPCVEASLAGAEPSCSLKTHTKPSCAQGRAPSLPSAPLGEVEGHRAPSHASLQAGGVPSLLPSSGLEQSPPEPQPPEEEELGVEQSPGEPRETTRASDPFPALEAQGGLARDGPLPRGKGAQGGRRGCPRKGAPRPGSAPPMEPPAGSRLEEQDIGGAVMEAESSEPDSFPATEPLSTRAWKPAGRPAAFGSAGASAAVGFSGSPPPASEEQLGHVAEEAGPSLASALKELHQLLVASYPKASWQESVDQPGAPPEEKVAGEEILGGARLGCRDPAAPGEELPSPGEGPECVPGEASSAGGLFPGAGAENERETLTAPDKEPLGLDLNSSVVPRLLGASCEPLVAERSERSLPLGSSSDQVAGNKALGQTPPPPNLTEGGDIRDVLNAPPRLPGPLPTCSLERAPAAALPPIQPSAGADRLVRAGFTSQEAREALERAGGNADLALLILLAKKIVVPT